MPEPRCLCARCLQTIASKPDVTWEELAAARVHVITPGEGDSYMENGYVVFTAQFLLRRGYCCGSGCRHCPY
jgi:hypothetical protein